MNDDKYIVFKREDWERFERDHIGPMNGDAGISKSAVPDRIQDAVVIRQQDIFAPPALDMYANSIRCALAVMGPDNVDTHLARDLATKADYFHEAATESWMMDRKIPD